MTETLRTEQRHPIVAGKIGHWRISDPNGVECPFCKTWNNLPEPKCPKCWARLGGVKR